MIKNILLILAMFTSSLAIADEPNNSKVEKLGKLAGELILHANVLKNLDALCYPNKPETNYMDILLNDIKTMPIELQDIVNLQAATTNNLAALIANGMVKKANGCETDDFRNSYSKTEALYQSALLNWLQKTI